ncbi:MAG: acyltransferase [Scytonema sp. PMC 1069.18]|nr:acyltransferase [Scytonema sp. PMC 1069.18]MEC4883768.1 acyltransferase [Scytonema sp. PMC 1070.18]
MANNNSLSQFQRFQEVLVTSLLGGLPNIVLGPKLRNLVYRNIFPRLGRSVYIQDGVEFIGTSSIYLENNVFLFRGVRIDGKGHPNNKICIEDGVAIERNVSIGCVDDTRINIGQETFIGPSVCIAGPGDIMIGKRCLIAAHTGIYANNHNFSDPIEPIKYQGISRVGIVIEDDCWIGHGAVILDGVTVGQGSVIGAGAVVTKDIPPFSVAVGVPARIIKSRTSSKQLVNSRE